jgi:hypothetical protein
MPTTPHPLLAEIIDYAGLFPPARLPMDEAFNRFLQHRSSAGGGLLGRFVCPAPRLGELGRLVESADLGRAPIRIAALGSGGDDPPSFAEAIERDVAAMGEFANRHRPAALVDVFEVKLPAEGEPAEVVDYVFDQLGDTLPHRVDCFFESPLLGDWRDRLDADVAGIAAAGHEIDPRRRAGLKIRCGGLDASAIPGVEAVAAAVVAARDRSLPLKATQGLHHPFRHRDDALGAAVHGFLNLAFATILAGAHHLDDRTVREIIVDDDPGSFSVTGASLKWRNIEVSYDSVRGARASGFAGFGSCSFSEPRDDLSALGLL